MTDGEATLGPPERLHPLSLLASLRASVRGMWGLFAAGGYFAVQGRWLLLLLMLALFTVISVGSALLRWGRFRFRVGEREIRIDSGLLNRTHRSIPFDRIQDVTVEQGPLARALGLARVRFETGGSSGAKEDDGSLAAIPLARAGEIRELVRASRGLVPETARVGPVVEGAPVFAMDLKRVLLAGVFNFSLAVIGGLVGISQTFGEAMGFDPFEREFWEGLVAADSPLGDLIRLNAVFTAVAGGLVLILIGLGTGALRTLLRDYGFRLDQVATGLRRRRGLLTITDVTLPAKRTQAVVVATGPVRDRFGWSELKLQSLAKEDGGKGDHVVAPLARETEIAGIMEALAWPPPGEPAWQRVSRAYVWTLVAGFVPLFLLFGLQLLVIAWIPSIAGEGADGPLIGAVSPALFVTAAIAAILVASIALRWLDWRRYRYALDGDRLLVRSGWWRRRLRILPVKSIQSLDYRQSFVDRWFGVASLTIGVAGGGLAGHGIRALPVKCARSLRDQLLSRFT
jgi:putative membrane protein